MRWYQKHPRPQATMRRSSNWKPLGCFMFKPEERCALRVGDHVDERLSICGMTVRQRECLTLMRGHYDADPVADDTVEGTSHKIICECKFWTTNSPAQKVRAFQVAVDETGANRGYILSRKGFQSVAILAAHATSVELATYEQFHEFDFEKWFRQANLGD